MRLVISSVLGGPDAADAVRGTLQDVKDEFTRLAGTLPPADLDTVDIRLFVSGSITTYPAPEGFNKLTLLAKKRLARAQVTIHQDTWRAGPQAFREALKKAVLRALAELRVKASKAGIEASADDMIAKVESSLG